MRHRGFTLMEVLVYGVILAIASSSIMYLMISLGKTQQQTTDLPTAQSQAQDAITAVAAYLRRAPLCDAASGCTDLADSAFKVAGTNALTVFTTPGGQTASFTNNNGTLVRTIGGTSVTIITDSLSIKFQYLLSPDMAYTLAGGTWTWQDSVTGDANLKAIMGVKITATVTRYGATSVQSSIVRLRNSPKKVFTTS